VPAYLPDPSQPEGSTTWSRVIHPGSPVKRLCSIQTAP